MWYHFAFMAISLAMFGLAAGAILVEVIRKRDAHAMLANTGLLFALTSAICFAVQLYIPPIRKRKSGGPLWHLPSSPFHLSSVEWWFASR